MVLRLLVLFSFIFLLTPMGGAFESDSNSQNFKNQIQPFFNSYCLHCHGPKKSKAKIKLHLLSESDFSKEQNLKTWEKLLEVLKSKEMPPEDERQPRQQDRADIAHWIENEFQSSLKGNSQKHSSEPTVRRLTNIEYENTIRDLLGFRLKLIENLPKDPQKPYRFNNTAEFMLMGPEQIDRYLENARRALASAIVDPDKPEVHRTRRDWKPHNLDRGLGLDEVGVWGNRRHSPHWGMGLKSFPKTGEFRIRIQASAILPPGITELPLRLVMGYSLNINSSTQRMEPVGTVQLRNTLDQPRVYEFRGRIENFPAKPGKIVNGRRQADTMVVTPQNLYDDGTLNDGQRPLEMPRAVIQWMEFEAPLVQNWPPEHHKRILFESSLRQENPEAYVQEVFRRFMSRAYRRPATENEVSKFFKIYQLISESELTFEEVMRETLAMVLISPQFLYHTVQDEQVSPHYEIASKLSYFLWASMPDEELMKLAEEQKLLDNKIIDQQVRRLLKDSRSNSFVKIFTSQWLSLTKLKTVPINKDLFPRFLYYVPRGERAGTEEPYRPTIRDYMFEETVGFISELIRENETVSNLVDSNFAYLNQPLAAHYGVQGIEGNQLRRVPLNPESNLGGLLTQGSILIGNGTGTAPHPIYRAVWLREAILGDEVPPPPAEVPALTDSAGESAEKALTIKDLLAKHREDESCNDCHARLDPWGIPFERYNAIGKYQPMVPKEGTRVRGFDKKTHQSLIGYQAYLQSLNTISIQADARLPNGPRVEGMRDLKNYLLKNRKEDIAKNVLKRFLGYGLGRELTVKDRFQVQTIFERSKAEDFKLKDMIIAICQSKIFTGVKSK